MAEISKSILVELHGGTFHLASEPGKGTIVTVHLPGTRAGNLLKATG